MSTIFKRPFPLIEIVTPSSTSTLGFFTTCQFIFILKNEGTGDNRE